jgi:hypothetical protein
LAIRIYVTHSGRTIKLHTENSHLCQVITTFSTGLTALNGLTTQVQSFATGTSGTDFGISSATSTHTFNLPTASAANRGALSSTDWTTFNNKFTLPTLTSGSVLFSNGTTIAQDNAQLFWDDTNNRLGIGTNAPAAKFTVQQSNQVYAPIDLVNFDIALGIAANSSLISGLDFKNFNSAGQVRFMARNNQDDYIAINSYGSAAAGTLFGLNRSGLTAIFGQSTVDTSKKLAIGTFNLGDLILGTNNAERMRIFANGNIGINTTTDAGFKLDVNGTARVSGNATFGTLGTGTGMFWDNTNNRLGIGTNAPAETLEISSTGATGFAIKRNATSNAARFFLKTSGTYNWSIGLRATRNDFSIFNEASTEALTINATTNNVLINTTTDVASSKLTIQSTTQGFLPPRMTNAQRLAIATPAVGLIVYCTDVVEGLYINKPTGWTFVI